MFVLSLILVCCFVVCLIETGCLLVLLVFVLQWFWMVCYRFWLP